MLYVVTRSAFLYQLSGSDVVTSRAHAHGIWNVLGYMGIV